jgi:hypoxanthine phosphoribosyltransferase
LGHSDRADILDFRVAAHPSLDSLSDTAVRQRQLNLPWTFNRPAGGAKFAHPAELELARILSFYRIRWLYEPTTFVLRNGADGRPAESFSPDFYLPDHRQYIELTTMRQALVTRKNRKLRQLRELYPGVSIKLLYRRDVERLFRSYDDCWKTVDPIGQGRLIVDSETIEQRIHAVADEIVAESRQSIVSAPSSTGLTIVEVLPGPSAFCDRLTSAIEERGLRFERCDVSITRFRATSTRQNVRISRAPGQPLDGRGVLLIADVVSSGLSLNYLVDWIRRQGAKDVQVCAFFDRKSARLVELPVRYAAFEAPDEPLIGYGIGACAEHRNLAFVATLDE